MYVLTLPAFLHSFAKAPRAQPHMMLVRKAEHCNNYQDCYGIKRSHSHVPNLPQVGQREISSLEVQVLSSQAPPTVELTSWGPRSRMCLLGTKTTWHNVSVAGGDRCVEEEALSKNIILLEEAIEYCNL